MEGVRYYKCLKCSKEFTRKDSLHRHIAKHRDVRVVHSCEVCPSTFSRKDNLQKHEKVVHADNTFLAGSPPKQKIGIYKCKVCSKEFVKKYFFLLHLEKHKEVRQGFSCEICGTTYSSIIYDLDDWKSLLDDQSHKCPKCFKEFTRKDSLKRHFQKHKDVREMFSCSYCSSTFTRKDTLRFHLKNFHGVLKI
ncbi:hypothetical protein JTE90_027596 [Oedothorax gibbosus]|uniref:C2H2-type domain-containing protein n=1 Tax=Oedothorax gibbosus TaxID=931172 RepID=A0AAV6VMX2_9ARAC|nr:hypothetical protein JTE90_027596 [Oedothorax gibbosus]